MSVATPFAGKFRFADTSGGGIRFFGPRLDESMYGVVVLYDIGPDMGPNLRACVMQLQAIYPEMVKPGDLPYCTYGASNASSSSLNGSADAAHAWRFYYMLRQAMIINTWYSPPPRPTALLGYWAVPSGREFGWADGGTVTQLGFVCPLEAPARWYLDAFLSGSCDGFDYSWVDLSGEDYSNESITNANWQHADLTGTNFSAATLNGAQFAHTFAGSTNFRGARLSDASFHDVATIAGAVFENAVMERVDLRGVDCTGQNFRGADLSGSATNVIAAILDGADFTGATLSGVDFTGVGSLRQAKFTNATLNDAVFRGVDLTGVDFTGAQLLGTDLSHTDLTVCTFSPAPAFSRDPANRTTLAHSKLHYAVIGNLWMALDLSGANIVDLPQTISGLDARSAVLTRLQLANMTLQGALFQNAVLQGVNFGGTDLSLANFDSAVCDGDAARDIDAAVFSHANLLDANFANAHLTGADFSYAFFWGSVASLAGATVYLANFANAFLSSVDFSAVQQKQCAGANFTGACLVNAIFTNTDLQSDQGKRVSFARAALQGVNFQGATLYDADLAGAAVATASGTIAIDVKAPPPGMPPPPTLQYGATIAITAATGAATVCPNGDDGPCSGAKLASPIAPMNAWPAES